MHDENPSPETAAQGVQSGAVPLSPWRCLVGAVLAAVLAYGMYSLTSAIAHSFAAKPIHTDNYIVQRISAAVRTLVVGMTTLGTGVFSFASLGLLGLGLQLTIQNFKGNSVPPASP